MGAWGKQNQTSRAGRGLCGRRGCAHLRGCSHLQHVRELQDVDGSRCLSSSRKRAARRLVVVDRHAASDSCPTGADSPPPPPPILPFWLVLWPRGAKMTHGGRWRQRHRWTAKSLSFPTVYCAAPGASSKVARQAVLESNTAYACSIRMSRTVKLRGTAPELTGATCLQFS